MAVKGSVPRLGAIVPHRVVRDSAAALGGSACVFQVSVPDVDAAYKKAVDEGGSPALPPTSMFWGDCYGWLRDPFGHVWALNQVQETLSPEEVAERIRGFASSMKGKE